jgi:hypothetical protein
MRHACHIWRERDVACHWSRGGRGRVSLRDGGRARAEGPVEIFQEKSRTPGPIWPCRVQMGHACHVSSSPRRAPVAWSACAMAAPANWRPGANVSRVIHFAPAPCDAPRVAAATRTPVHRPAPLANWRPAATVSHVTTFRASAGGDHRAPVDHEPATGSTPLRRRGRRRHTGDALAPRGRLQAWPRVPQTTACGTRESRARGTARGSGEGTWNEERTRSTNYRFWDARRNAMIEDKSIARPRGRPKNWLPVANLSRATQFPTLSQNLPLVGRVKTGTCRARTTAHGRGEGT